MSISERFQYEADVLTQSQIDEAEAEVSKVDELRMWLRNSARVAAKELQAMRLLDRHGLPGCDSEEEVIEGAAEEADELFEKLLDKVTFRETKRIANSEAGAE